MGGGEWPRPARSIQQAGQALPAPRAALTSKHPARRHHAAQQVVRGGPVARRQQVLQPAGVVGAVAAPQRARLGQPGGGQAEAVGQEGAGLRVVAPLIDMCHQQFAHDLRARQGGRQRGREGGGALKTGG